MQEQVLSTKRPLDGTDFIFAEFPQAFHSGGLVPDSQSPVVVGNHICQFPPIQIERGDYLHRKELQRQANEPETYVCSDGDSYKLETPYQLYVLRLLQDWELKPHRPSLCIGGAIQLMAIEEKYPWA